MKKSTIIIAVAGALLSAALAGAAVWWFKPAPAAAAAAEKAAKPQQQEKREKAHKYVTLDKVIVMLRRAPGETASHYLAADLVLAVPAGKDKLAKEHLPLLRSIAVRTLSGYTVAEASTLTVEQYAEQLNRTFSASYAADKGEKPFTEVMIGKLIIE
jgi:flagellar FliL protein